MSLAEGATQEVVLELDGQDAGLETAPGALGTSSETSSPDKTEGGGALRPTLIYGGFSLAALGIGTGAVTGVMAMSDAKALKDDYACDFEGICDQGGEDAQSRASTLGIISTVGFGVGAFGVALGVWGLMMDQPDERVSVNQRGMRLTFDVGTTNRLILQGAF